MHRTYTVEVTRINFLQASEAIDTRHAQQLAQTISEQQAWCLPIPIERCSGLVMDGNHRLFAARLLGLSHVPCVLLDYTDSRVNVRHWATDQAFDLEALYRAIGAGQLLPYKTTRHAFAPALPSINVPLADLRQAAHPAPVKRIRHA